LGRSWFALAILASLAASPAFSQYSSVIAACRWDSKQVCAGALPEGGRLARCIEENFDRLGDSCRAALVNIATVRQACGADIAQQCPGTKPGAGRLLLCVKRHYAALGETCRDAIGHAVERHVRAH
jgi:hypothetical protein